MADFDTLESLTLISRKIWMTEKFCSFHSALYYIVCNQGSADFCFFLVAFLISQVAYHHKRSSWTKLWSEIFDCGAETTKSAFPSSVGSILPPFWNISYSRILILFLSKVQQLLKFCETQWYLYSLHMELNAGCMICERRIFANFCHRNPVRNIATSIEICSWQVSLSLIRTCVK